MIVEIRLGRQMSKPNKHHYNPQFHLFAWARSDGKVCRFRWVKNKLVTDWNTPKHTAFEPDLYSMENPDSSKNPSLETGFFSPLDSRAAHVLRKLVETDVSSLTPGDRDIWIRYVMSLHTRNPGVVRFIRDTGTTILRQELSADPEKYESVRQTSDPDSLLEWVKTNLPGAIENFGILHLPELIDGPPWVPERIRGMNWWIRRFEDLDAGLLISDRPLILRPNTELHNAKCLIALPLAPKVVFFATSDEKVLEEFLSLEAIPSIEKINAWSVQQAVSYVWGGSVDQYDFVQKILRKPGIHRNPGIF